MSADMTGRYRLRLAIPLLGLAVGLSGCSGFSEALGYNKQAPDEFAIVSKAPLIIPPDYSLRPPQPGAPRPQEVQPISAAETAVFGAGAASNANLSTGESAILAAAGADQANPEIRSVINYENRTLVEKEKTIVDDILYWREPSAPDEQMVDAAAEARRIREGEAVGIPASEGETPTVEPRKKGWLEDLF